jgi:hypothetical protein
VTGSGILEHVRRYLAAGIWLVMTVTSTFIVWEAVSVVAADVTDRPAPVVAEKAVAVDLKNGSSTTTTTAAPPAVPHPVTPTTTSRPGGAGVTVTTVPGGSVSASPGVSGSGGPAPAVATPSPPTTQAPVHSTATPPSTAASAATGGTATYSTGGGVVAVACTSFNTIRLVAAAADDGYQALVFSGGPQFVAVNFVGMGHNYPVAAACVFGQPFEFNKSHTAP